MDKTNNILKGVKTLIFSALVVVCFNKVVFADNECNGVGVALTTGITDNRPYEQISSVISGSSTSRKVSSVEGIPLYLENQEWEVQFENGIVHGYSGCAGRNIKADNNPYPYNTFSASSAYSGCLCSLTENGDTWFTVNMSNASKAGNVVEDSSSDWDGRNSYCRQYCSSRCAEAFANDTNGLRTAMVNNYGSCPVVSGGITTKYCTEGKYLPANATADTQCLPCEPGYYCPGNTYNLGIGTWQGIYVCPNHSNSTGNSATCKCDTGYSKDGTFEGEIYVGRGETCSKIEIDLMSVNTNYFTYNTDIESLESLVYRGIVTARRQEDMISRSNNKIQNLFEYTKDESWSVTFVDAHDELLYSVSGYAFCSTKSNESTTPIGTRVSYGSIENQAYVGCWCKLGENGNDGNYWTRLDYIFPNYDEWYEDTNECRESCPARCAAAVATDQEFREYIYDSDTIPTDTGCEDGYAWSSSAYMCKKLCVEHAHDNGNDSCVCNDGYVATEYQNGDASVCVKEIEIIFNYTNGGAGCENETMLVGETKQLNCVPTKDGYVFAGWYDEVVDGSKIESVDANSEENIVLYAHWQRQITIHFDPNADGYEVENIPEDVVCLENEDCKVFYIRYWNRNTAVHRNGYSFISWKNIAANGTESYFEYDSGESVPGNAIRHTADLSNVFNSINDGENEITLYAQWSPLNYDIIYHDADETISGIPQNSYTYSDSVNQSITPTAPVKPGYKFIGWCDNYELEGDCEKTIVIPAGTTEDKNYYALWELRCSNNEYYNGSQCVCKNGYVLQEMPWSNNYKIDADDYEPYQTAHPDTYIAMRDAMKWRVEWFDNPENREMAGIELSGDAACSLDASVEMVNGVATSGSDVREDLNGQGQYCWCRMTAPAKSKWVYVANLQSGSYDDCKKRCPGYCGGYVSGITVQSNVRKAIYDNVINNEQHMVCLPNDEEPSVDNQCENGPWLHVGNDKMCLSEGQDTHPALAIKSGNKTYYLNMSGSNLPITNGSSKKMRVLYDGDVYNIHDNSVE